jgi:hypothetical protein
MARNRWFNLLILHRIGHRSSAQQQVTYQLGALGQARWEPQFLTLVWGPSYLGSDVTNGRALACHTSSC